MLLFTKDSKSKIRIVSIEYEWSDNDHSYLIHRRSGLLGGKFVDHPDIKVSCGKAKRTLKEQVKLQYDAKIKEYKDKGYRECKSEDLEEEKLDKLWDKAKSLNGAVKPMLAKQASDISNKEIFEKYDYYASRKIDGLRCSIYLGQDGKLHTSSRGGSNYDPALIEIIRHPKLVELFKEHPDLIMDGECYKHGLSLQKINSIARTQVTATDYSILQFYWYDIVATNMEFSDRLGYMQQLSAELNIGFNPERDFEYGELRIQLVPQVLVRGFNNMMQLHNQYVSEGWEGVVIRRVDSYYKPNGRTSDMIKIKEYQDSEFKITGYELGLRGSEDMCFKCITSDGKEFLAKPHGDRALKRWYIDNFEKECLNQNAVVKYFYMSDDGIPLQPSVKCIRLKADTE